ncbi:hypothetical protein GGR53DRAFT_513073 [Hypoxylon sp. FL1150]|nr:hypothetical protein GGR53DRAFT_513073 [Hypoxylon sp. FL1150]
MHIVQGDCLWGHQDRTDLIDPLFRARHLKKLQPRYATSDDYLEGESADWSEYTGEEMYLWLVTLAMVLRPRLESLLLAIDDDEDTAELWTLERAPHGNPISPHAWVGRVRV